LSIIFSKKPVSTFPDHALERYWPKRPQFGRLPVKFDHSFGIFHALGFGELAGVGHATGNARHAKAAVLRHRRVDEQIVAAGAVGRVAVSNLARKYCAVGMSANTSKPVARSSIGPHH
jgi:hypothetical protein